LLDAAPLPAKAPHPAPPRPGSPALLVEAEAVQAAETYVEVRGGVTLEQVDTLRASLDSNVRPGKAARSALVLKPLLHNAALRTVAGVRPGHALCCTAAAQRAVLDLFMRVQGVEPALLAGQEEEATPAEVHRLHHALTKFTGQAVAAYDAEQLSPMRTRRQAGALMGAAGGGPT
jgi:hypothetical protein